MKYELKVSKDKKEYTDATIERVGKDYARLTRGGPGDNSKPGQVDTDQWWADVSKLTKSKAFKAMQGTPPEEKTLIQQAKDIGGDLVTVNDDQELSFLRSSFGGTEDNWLQTYNSTQRLQEALEKIKKD